MGFSKGLDMDTREFDEENLAKHKERCDMIEDLARADDENRLLKNELELFRTRVEQFGKMLYDTNRMLVSEAERQILDMWPKFEDGEYVRIGDAVGLVDDDETLYQVHIGETGYSLYTETHDEWHDSGDAVKRPAPKDSWERLEADAAKGVCEYAEAERKPGTIDAHTCCGCRFDEYGDGPTCEKQMVLDIIRRAKALAGVEVE